MGQGDNHPIRALVGVLIVAALWGAGCLAEGSDALPSFAGQCVGVRDGDSIVVMHGPQEEEVRLDGVDCPELGQAFGRKAKEFTASLVFGNNVKVVPTTVDRYGRTVARVYVSGVDLSLALVQTGLAWHFKKYSTDPVLAAAEEQARRSARGLWVDKRATPPWVFRHHEQSPVVVEDGLLPPDAATTSTDEPFHGNKKSKVFHAARCPQFACPNCTEVFATREAAIAAGYRPCGICKP